MTDDSADAGLGDEPEVAPAASTQPQTIAVEHPTSLLPASHTPAEDAPTAPRAGTGAGTGRGAGAAGSGPSPGGSGAGGSDPGSAEAATAGTEPDPAGAETEPSKAGPAVVRSTEPRGWSVPVAVAVAAAAVVTSTLVIVFDRPSGGEPTPGPTPAGAACLLGRWQSTQLLFNGVPATGTETITFGADGTGVDSVDNVTVGLPDGHTHMLDGDIAFRYIAATGIAGGVGGADQSGIVNYTSPSGTLVDQDLTGGPTTRETPRYAPRTYTCSATALELTNGTATSHFTRS